MLDSLISKAYVSHFVTTWNKLLSMVVRVSHFSFSLVQIFCVCVLPVMSNVQIYKTDWTLSLLIHVNGLLLIPEINEIAPKTQCLTLLCHLTQGWFDFTNIIIEKEIRWGSNPRLSDRKQCPLTPWPSRHCPTS